MHTQTHPVSWFLLVCLSMIWCPESLAQRRADRENPYEKVSDVYQDLWKKGLLKQALAHVDKAIRDSPESVPVYWLTDRAELFFETGRINRAIDEMEWLQYRRPSPIYAWQLGRYYQAAGRLAEFRTLLEQAWRRASRYRRDDLETEEALALNAIAEWRGENPRNIFQSILKGKMKTKDDRLWRYTAAGELAVRKFDYALAASYFEKALAEDETHLPALGGLATCYWHSYDQRLESTLDRIDAINPHDPTAEAIRTEQDLDANELDKAMARIDKQLDINRFNLRFLGLKMAALFLQDNVPGLSSLKIEILAFNPHASEVFRIAGRIASRKYRFEEGAAFQKQALDANPEDALARAFYAQDLLRLGKDEEGRARLQEAFAMDRFNVQVFNILELMDKVADFEEIKRGSFLLRMPKEEVSIWGDDVLALLEESHDRYVKKYQVKLKTPIAVQIFDNHDDFMVRSVGLPGNAGHLGICFGQLITMDSPSARQTGTMNWRSVMLHEFVHVITLQKTNNRMARWLSEGISVYEQIETDPGWAHPLDMNYKWMIEADGYPKVSDLPRLFSQPRTPGHLMFGYFAAGEFVRFYVKNYGFKALNKAMEAIGEGQPTLDAVLEASTKSEKEMDQAFKAFLKQRFKGFEALPEVNGDFLKAYKAADEDFVGMPFKEEPGPFHQKLAQAEAAAEKKNWAEAEKLFWEAQELFPEYRGPEAPLNRLSEIFAEQEKYDALEKVLHQAVWGGETEYGACVALAGLYQQQKKWPELLKTTRRALDIDPFDMVLNRMQLQALNQLKQPQKQLETLAKLIVIDEDRRNQYRLDRVDLLLETGNKQTAKEEVLDLLEEMPSWWQAQQRLLTIIEGGGGR